MPARFALSPVTYGLIAVTLLVFLAQVLSQSVLGFDLVSLMGAKDNLAIATGQVWRFITPMFIHGGYFHLLINLYSLYAIGPVVERFFGPWRTLALYLLSGTAGVLLSVSFSSYRSVGSSGSIFGLLGSLGAFLYANRSTFGQAGTIQLRQIVLVALFNLGLGLSPGIDNWGHLGGLIFGAGLTWFTGPNFALMRDETADRFILVDQRPWRRVWLKILLSAVVVASLALVARLLLSR